MFKTLYTKLSINFFIHLLLLILGLYIIQIINEKREEYSLQVQSNLIQSKYTTNYQNFKVFTKQFSLLYQINKELITLLRNANDIKKDGYKQSREKISHLLLKNFKRLQTIGIYDVQFYLKNNKFFLSLLNPSNSFEHTLHINDNIIRTNPDEVIEEGFKLSKTRGLVFSYPLFDKYNQYIAGVEFTYSPQWLIKNMLDEYSYDFHFLISKLAFEKNKMNKLESLYENTWEAENFFIDSVTHKKMRIINLYHTIESENLQKQIKEKIKTKKTFSLQTKHKYTTLIMTFLPLQDIMQNFGNVYLVVYSQSNYLEELIKENTYLIVIFILFLILFFIFISYILINEDKLGKLALYDNVTKLPNRRLCLINLHNEISKAHRYKHKVAFLFIDLDGFKMVNDTYGHQIGDDLLLYVANSFQANVRKTDTVARIGGDEYVIILTNVDEATEAVKLAENIIKIINKPIKINEHTINIGASIGISIYPDHTEDEEVLIKIADTMMYESKKQGKNRVTIFSKS